MLQRRAHRFENPNNRSLPVVRQRYFQEDLPQQMQAIEDYDRDENIQRMQDIAGSAPFFNREGAMQGFLSSPQMYQIAAAFASGIERANTRGDRSGLNPVASQKQMQQEALEAFDREMVENNKKTQKRFNGYGCCFFFFVIFVLIYIPGSLILSTAAVWQYKVSPEIERHVATIKKTGPPLF